MLMLGLVAFGGNITVFRGLVASGPAPEAQSNPTILVIGLVVFLLVLAHSFGHSLASYLGHRDAGTSSAEQAVPMAVSGLGLVLVTGVLFEARSTLGSGPGETGLLHFGMNALVVLAAASAAYLHAPAPNPMSARWSREDHGRAP